MKYFILKENENQDQLTRIQDELAINFASINNHICSDKYENFEEVLWAYPKAGNIQELERMNAVLEIFDEYMSISYEDEISYDQRISRYEEVSQKLKRLMDLL